MLLKEVLGHTTTDRNGVSGCLRVEAASAIRSSKIALRFAPDRFVRPFSPESLFECAISRIYADSAVSALGLEQALACKTGCPLLARSLWARLRQPRRQSFFGQAIGIPHSNRLLGLPKGRGPGGLRLVRVRPRRWNRGGFDENTPNEACARRCSDGRSVASCASGDHPDYLWPHCPFVRSGRAKPVWGLDLLLY